MTIGEDTTVPITLRRSVPMVAGAGHRGSWLPCRGTLINLNAFVADNDADLIDGGADLCGSSIENVTVNGQIGNDLSAKGGDGTGTRWARPGIRLTAADSLLPDSPRVTPTAAGPLWPVRSMLSRTSR